MGLKTTSVAKCLDKRLLLFGFEVMDVLAIFLTLSILNLVFGQTPFKIVFVWIPTAALAAVLHFGKKGKPDNYLVHWLRFQMKPGTYKAFPDASDWASPPTFRGDL
ncbi:MAG: hypothetical protein HYX41_02660 [Bdellovibrio sp.]|nr:hypothetical protein [Bdellovibrio sp.]